MFIFEKEQKQWAQQLTKEVAEYNQRLQELREKQEKIKNVKKLALSILEYNKLETEISDRGYVITLLQQTEERFMSEYFKAEFYSYLEAGETVSSELVDFLTESFHEIVREEQFKDFDDEQSFSAHYKEYILPGKILAQKYGQLDDLIREMNEYLVRRDAEYDHKKSGELLYYAFSKALNSEIHLEPLIEGLRNKDYEYLSAEEKDKLLEEVGEKSGIKRFEEAKNQNLAMEKAIKILK